MVPINVQVLRVCKVVMMLHVLILIILIGNDYY
jgi:hypothetical protein